MALISIKDIRLAFSDAPVLDGVSMQIEAGERVCLVGRNGEGKSSLMRVVTGDMKPDGGEIAIGKGVRVARLSQDVPQDITGSVFEVVATGIGEMGTALYDYRSAVAAVERDASAMPALEAAQQAVDASGGWESYRTVETVLSRLKLDADAEFATLSGGLKRRVMLARALASDPDVLLLDEPTNHLDIDSITWLEEFLLRHVKTLFFVTHDRALLQKLATRIVELDRGHLADWRCDYQTYLTRKEELLNAEEKEWDRFDIKLAEEEQWLRKGVTARRRRNMGRLRDLKKMREQRKARRYRPGQAKMQLQEAGLSGKLVAEGQDLTVAFDGAPVFRNFTTAIMRGDKVGIIGPNGAGKTTLLRTLLGKQTPDSGAVRLGTNLEIAYFDQLRASLDMDARAYDVVGDGQEWVTVDGNKRHVMGYLQDFLFTRDRARSKVHTLSGGERNRLLLAKLFTRPSNVLVLDEPTNDLDAETLDLLEELLMQYSGTVLVVSHDRAFLNNVVTSTIAFEADGVVREYVGGYDDWLRQCQQAEENAGPKKAEAPKPRQRPRADGKRKLTFNEQRERDALQSELDGTPARIEAMEAALEDLSAKLADPDFYQRDPAGFEAATQNLGKAEADLDAALERWEEIESRLAELSEDGPAA
ncbi:ATP-binding cassette domain-containing protein [Desulfobaculum senezii]